MEARINENSERLLTIQATAYLLSLPHFQLHQLYILVLIFTFIFIFFNVITFSSSLKLIIIIH